jgi:multimeric flavodoxin WrbA
MKALILNASLKRSPEPSNTEALAQVVLSDLNQQGVTCEVLRLADWHIPPGVTTDAGPGDEWPEIHRRLLASEILILASATWLAPGWATRRASHSACWNAWAP